LTHPGSNFEGAGSSIADQARDQVQQVADQAREKAVDAKDQARSKVKSTVDERTTQLGELVRSRVQELRTVGEELQKQGQDSSARLAEKAAERGERVAGYLTEADGDRLLRDIEGFGRRNPWAVVAGGLAVGFLASRFLKASSQSRYPGGRAMPQPPRPSYDPQPQAPSFPAATPSAGSGAAAGSGASYGGGDQYTSTHSTEELRARIGSGGTEESRSAVQDLSDAGRGGAGGAV
jgi:ElaB/YqjD/DUF883 family membrane-anchored ribosome-binding protein